MKNSTNKKKIYGWFKKEGDKIGIVWYTIYAVHKDSMHG